ncbi:hypothetical protein [Undibacterium sp. SXout20W]|uniref:hypothetical protein n=1 Tax=Undibacterium sp. SXout20W TaxID=3413051 RepID=UPI003BF0193F
MNVAGGRMMILIAALIFSGSAVARREPAGGRGQKFAKESGKSNQSALALKRAETAPPVTTGKALNAAGEEAVNQKLPLKNQNEKPKAKLSREERIALRQQIHDVEQQLQAPNK